MEMRIFMMKTVKKLFRTNASKSVADYAEYIEVHRRTIYHNYGKWKDAK